MKLNFNPPKAIAPGLHPGIGLDQLKPIQCTCGASTFLPCYTAYIASPLQTIAGNQMVVQSSSGLICASCGQKNTFKQPAGNEKEASNHVKN